MAKTRTPTIKEIEKKLKRMGFKKTQGEDIATMPRPSLYDKEKTKRKIAGMTLKEPRPPYGKRK